MSDQSTAEGSGAGLCCDPEPAVSTHPQDIDYIRSNIPCQWACPAHTNIPGYILANSRDDLDASWLINRASNLLPGVLGRICSRPCEEACRHGDPDLGTPVGICHLKRVAADGRSLDVPPGEFRFPDSGFEVGIVGAGPAGLACAHSLALFGHRVKIYEMESAPGGMLRFGIPAFRLPRSVIDEEVGFITALGVEIEYGVRVGADVTLADLLERHDAVVVTAGCYSAYELDIPGTDREGVHSGLDFMVRINTGDRPAVGRRTVVIGGGFTAFDCARSALRLGAEEVSICILGVEELLSVTDEEIIEAKREGVAIRSLLTSLEITGSDRVEGVRLARNRLGGVDERGRRRTIPIEGSEFTLTADTVIAAIGQKPEPALAGSGLADEPVFAADGSSNIEGLWAAGDFLSGSSTVIESVGRAKAVATRIDTRLSGRTRREEIVTIDPATDTDRRRDWDFIDRQEMPLLPLTERLAGQEVEVEQGLDGSGAEAEARRCYLCNLKYEIDIDGCIYCRWCIDQCPRECIGLARTIEPGEGYLGETIEWTEHWDKTAGIVIDSSRCIRCGICLRICPTRCIGVRLVNLVERFISDDEEADDDR